MKQYCRYCANCVLVDEDVCYCEESRKTFWCAKARRVNKCKNFVLNKLDVFNIEHTYKPIEDRQKQGKANGEQMTLFKE